MDELDSLAWAKRPKTQHALDLVAAGAKEGDARLVSVRADHERSGVCDEAGKLLMRWDGLRLVRVADEEGRRDAA
jgi:hypothetical protein